MEEQLANMQKEIVRLKWQSGILALLLRAAAFTGSDTTRFKEISVERINVLESDGRLRMVISNQSRSLEVLSQGISRRSQVLVGDFGPLIDMVAKAGDNGNGQLAQRFTFAGVYQFQRHETHHILRHGSSAAGHYGLPTRCRP